ncbi:MAG: thiamine-phosphate kinase [Betaproteobacteria bacterium]|nr:thiamine-phosphate kinase [Betaproteobacteria bacterium]
MSGAPAAALSEFGVIRRFFTRASPHAVLGVGDDAALVRPSEGMLLAVSADMLLVHHHFFPDDDPFQLGAKCLAVNLSDMAAMGAKPRWATLGLALPEVDEPWLEQFSAGFFALARRYGVDLVGGDTSRGPLTVCVQIMGEVPPGQALRRSGAQPGDDLWVSGHLGDAALALAYLQRRIALSPAQAKACLPALHAPTPRVKLGLALRGLATSAIDLSDGLASDLSHVLEASGVAAEVDASRLPVSPTGAQHLTAPAGLACVVAGGEDYELLFTAPAARREDVVRLARSTDVPLTLIGRIMAGTGLTLRDAQGCPIGLAKPGFDHFSGGVA